MEGGAPGQQPLPLSSPLRNEHCKYHTSRMANIFQQTLQKTVMPNTNIFSVAFQTHDIQRNPGSAPALTEFCHFLLT